ncbi:MAG: hypothetical protein N838_19850 [Thiohalocapsa sp. PB-PSB1]|jgi:hypothetical protein|nr:MAG: hypothetical protein N838_19850 [Thiohalocapsa sp. PB-PSB1]
MFRIDNTVTTTLDYPDLIIQTLHEPGANRLALLDLDWDLDCLDRHRDRDRKDMTSGREKPDVDWADVDWSDVDWALPSENMNQTSFWSNS